MAFLPLQKSKTISLKHYSTAVRNVDSSKIFVFYIKQLVLEEKLFKFCDTFLEQNEWVTHWSAVTTVSWIKSISRDYTNRGSQAYVENITRLRAEGNTLFPVLFSTITLIQQAMGMALVKPLFFCVSSELRVQQNKKRGKDVQGRRAWQQVQSLREEDGLCLYLEHLEVWKLH